jgi:hypothetical protein
MSLRKTRWVRIFGHIVKRYVKVVGVATGTAILIYAIWCHVSINQMEKRIDELEFQFELVYQNADVSLALCVNIIESMERRQRSLENIVIMNDNLNLTLETVRTYNASARVERPTNHESVGGEP